ncbi:MAG: hypothetical protein QGM46_07940 [Actinomycetota bacterium]|nr:hypothetical protein [Actinomycetota bacterium]MDK1017265.1 hypothetical protein [Actinomycetota bacterium]MDK1026272.1 hypothetical protein [Actinomycetota bacterium]MDK1038942.1 hypothetical protein [Actinomycetota bacterium]MDK1097068.1 hypothetical protein [Actinomycetota bacterium]
MRFLRKFGFVLFSVTLGGVVAAFVVRRRVPSYGGETDDTFSVVAAMAGSVLESKTQGLKEGRATAFMGGVLLDLMDAEPAPGAILVLRAVMGGIDVVVPARWRVEVMGRSVLGGVANLTDPDGVVEGAPVLLVDALAVLGGIEIHAAEVT